MVELLDVVISHPLEREYEGWIVRCIEDYFAEAGVGAAVWAVSSGEEMHWPADLKINTSFPLKLFGVQVKRPYLKYPVSPLDPFNNLYWDLAHPAPQRQLVLATPNIYYCLPCFVNRNYRRVALPHCVFWRPTSSPVPSKVWHSDPHGKVRVADEMRWGRLIERLMRCEIGHLALNNSGADDFFESLWQFSGLPNVEGPRREKPKPNDQFTTVLMAVPIKA
jgi:hypothetical protein